MGSLLWGNGLLAGDISGGPEVVYVVYFSEGVQYAPKRDFGAWGYFKWLIHLDVFPGPARIPHFWILGKMQKPAE